MVEDRGVFTVRTNRHGDKIPVGRPRFRRAENVSLDVCEVWGRLLTR